MGRFLGYAKSDSAEIGKAWLGFVTDYDQTPRAGSVNDLLNYPERGRALNYTTIIEHPERVITKAVFKITTNCPRSMRPDLEVLPGIENSLYTMDQMISEGWFKG